MKLFILLLTITAVFSQIGGGGTWKDVPESDVETTTSLKEARDLGIEEVTKQAIEDDTLPANSELTVVSYESIQKQVVNGINYKFTMTLSDGETNLKTTFTVLVPPAGSNSERTVSGVSYEVVEPPPTMPGGWKSVPISEVESTTSIKEARDFGISEVTKQIIADGELPANSVMTVTDYNSVQKQVVNGMNYKFDCEVSDGKEGHFAVTFTVHVPLGGSNDPKTVKDITYDSVGEGTGTPGGWTNVPESEVTTNDMLKDALKFGVDEVTKRAITEKKLPANSVLTVSDYYTIQKQVVAGIKYKFDLKLSNGSGTDIKTTFQVWIKVTRDKDGNPEKEVSGISYEILKGDTDATIEKFSMKTSVSVALVALLGFIIV